MLLEKTIANETASVEKSVDDVQLSDILAAWNEATHRLQRTHESLQEEVGRLTRELETKNRQLARKNRLADLGQMASHIAHEVRNGLMPTTLYLSLLRRRLDADSGSLDVMNKIESSFTALEATVSDLLHFTADREPNIRSETLTTITQEILQGLAPQLEAQGITVEVDVPATFLFPLDRQMLSRAILNLLLNAIDAMPEGGNIIITSVETERGLELEIADNGPGLDEEAQQRLFEPFFTTKSDGTGLGLAIVYRVAEAHGGDVVAANCAEGGAAFTIRIPRRSERAAA